MAKHEIISGYPSHETKEVAISESFKNGINLALRRLEQVLDHYSQINGAELARNFEGYINSMMQIADWDGAFLYGILKVLGTVQSFADSEKSPREIVDEISSMFRNEETMKTFNESLSKEDVNVRHKIIKALAFQFHPESSKVRSLDTEEIQRRTDIFKTRISKAIQEDGRKGLELLQTLIKELDITVEE